MVYCGRFVAILVAALAFPLAASGQAAGGKTAAGAIRAEDGMAAVENAATSIKRYKKTLIDGHTEYNLPPVCTNFDPGSWTVNTKPKYGKTSTGTATGTLANGDCPGKKFTFAVIYYEWTEHSNKSNTDTFTATWTSTDYNQTYSYDVTVPIVRPTGETTAFTGWAETRGLWEQTLKPPGDDPDFDFSNETVKETNVGARDTCFDGQFPFGQATLTEHRWTVHDRVKWGPDGVGWGANTGSGGSCAIEYYRCVKKTPCGSILQQQMQISSPADKGAFVNFGPVNTLSANIEGITLPFSKSGLGNVTSQRGAGAKQSLFWPTGPLNCPKIVSLSKC
jgi:hypothetical protein